MDSAVRRRGRPFPTAVALLLGALVLIVFIGAAAVTTIYNHLVTLDQAVQSQWAQVQNVYQRRADLVPNLVATVKGAADFEKSTYVAVADARAKVGQVNLNGVTVPNDAATFQRYAAAQDNLGNALSHLIAVAENYPALKATQNFSDLQAQLEGTENRIAVERMRYNEAAQTFNATRDSFPAVMVAGFFGSRFAEKTYFAAQAGAEKPPTVGF